MRDLTGQPGLLALNTATTRVQWSLADAIEGAARHGFGAVAPWRDQVAATGLARTRRLIRDAGLDVTSLCRGGMFTAADAAGRERAFEDNLRALDEAATLETSTLVLVVGGIPGALHLDDARKQVADAIVRLAEAAQEREIQLAIEPLHPMYAADRACINTLAQALGIARSAGNTGVIVDVYHVWWDPELDTSITAASDKILGYHVSDWLVPTSDMLNDRGMPGDGVIDLPALRSKVEAAGWSGYVEIELFSERWWNTPGDTVLQTIVERAHTF